MASDTATDKSIAISRIRVDGGTQTRAGIRHDVVEEYREVLYACGVFPPVTVFDDGQYLWLADGFHRREAYLLAGKSQIPAVIKQGSRRDALMYNAGANDAHGIRRTNDDKRNAVRMVLADDEWRQSSDRWIGDRCRVSDHTVAAVRAESTAHLRSCPRKTEDHAIEIHDDQVKRLGKDGKERPAKRLVSAPSKVAVPEHLLKIFDEATLLGRTEAALAKTASMLQECETSKAYQRAHQRLSNADQRHYSSMLFTAQKRLRDYRPCTVCRSCEGKGCGTCAGDGWLAQGECDE